MIYGLYIHADADADLEALWLEDPDAAADILALIDELREDQDLLDRLSQHGFGTRGVDDFNVSEWTEQVRRKNRNLWRLKIFDVPKYRILYGFEPKRRHYHILGIMLRSVDYDRSHPICQRVERAYDDL